MNVYDKIEKLYSEDKTQPAWTKEILSELKEIKILLKDLNNPRRHHKQNRDYYDFINEFRKKMRADAQKESYPEVIYQNRRIGVNFNGHLYDKKTTNILPKVEAFTLYEYFYNKRGEINEYIIKN